MIYSVSLFEFSKLFRSVGGKDLFSLGIHHTEVSKLFDWIKEKYPGSQIRIPEMSLLKEHVDGNETAFAIQFANEEQKMLFLLTEI